MSRERFAGQIGTVERILFLKRLPAFEGLAPALLGVVADNALERHFRPGDVMLREGEPIRSLYTMVDGRVHITRRGQLLGHAGSGATVGGYAMFARDPDGIGAVAETDAIALELSHETVFEMLEDHFPILRHLLQDVCRQLIRILGNASLEVLPPLGVDSPTPASGELDLVERIFFLRHSPAFRHSSIGALAELSRGLTQVRLPPGRELWAAGDPAGWMLLIASGEVECHVPGQDAPFVAGPGFPLGGLDSIGGVPRWFRAQTRTTVVGLQGHVEGLIDVFEDNFDTAASYLAATSAWLLGAIERLGARELPGIEMLYGCDPRSEARQEPSGRDLK
jgi:CRP-like cAMP-binding protein